MTWRLSWHPWGPLCCGLLSALVAVYLIQLYIEQQLVEQAPLQQPPLQTQQIEVVVANQSLHAGQTLGVAVLSVRQVPSAGVATDSLHPADANWLIGQQLAHPVSAGQPIQRLHVATVAREQFSAVLQPGQRALTLNVGPQQSHAGMIRVGDKVDFFDVSSAQPKLLDNAIPVIATGADFKSRAVLSASSNDEHRRLEQEYRTLTFAISADKVPVYELLQRNHQLGFWLRAPADTGMLSQRAAAPEVDWIIGGRPASEPGRLAEPSWL